MTRAGRATLDRYDKLRLIGLRTCLSRVPEEQRDTVLAGLRVLVDAAEAGELAVGETAG